MKSARFKAPAFAAGTVLAALVFANNLAAAEVQTAAVSLRQSVPAHTDAGGKISAARTTAKYEWLHVSGAEDYISIFSLDGAHAHYRFRGVPAAFGNVDGVSAFTWQEWVFDPARGRALVALAAAGTSAADSVDFFDGSTFTAGLGFKQYFSREDSVMLGWTVSYSRLRERLYWFPIGFIDWRLSDDWKLSVSNRLKLSWTISPGWTLCFKTAYEFSSFQVKKHALWNNQYVPAGMSLTWCPPGGNGFFCTAGADAVLWSEWKRWENGSRQNHTKFGVDPTLEFFVEAGFKF